MHIRSLTAYLVRLPLRRPFVHASAARQESENIVIRCTLADDTTGWGEGVPREYVTGETPEGCLQQMAATDLAGQLRGDVAGWNDLIALCWRLNPAPMRDDPRGCYGNALRCAIELAVLDAFTRLLGQPLSHVTRHFPQAEGIHASRDAVRYSAAIGAESGPRLRQSALKLRLYGFHQCKVKVGADVGLDDERLSTIRRWLGSRVDLRLDANEAWPAVQIVPRLVRLAPYGATCIEQPCPHEEVEALAEVRRQIRVPVMLDESLASMADAEAAIAGRTCDLFNIRLSKCGGFLNSLRLAARANHAGLGYQLGCHPGESGILSAAGRHWATSVARIRYLEGSYDRHLLARQLTSEDVTFGYGGRAPALKSPGLGVTVSERALAELAYREQTFDLER